MAWRPAAYLPPVVEAKRAERPEHLLPAPRVCLPPELRACLQPAPGGELQEQAESPLVWLVHFLPALRAYLPPALQGGPLELAVLLVASRDRLLPALPVCSPAARAELGARLAQAVLRGLPRSYGLLPMFRTRCPLQAMETTIPAWPV